MLPQASYCLQQKIGLSPVADLHRPLKGMQGRVKGRTQDLEGPREKGAISGHTVECRPGKFGADGAPGRVTAPSSGGGGGVSYSVLPRRESGHTPRGPLQQVRTIPKLFQRSIAVVYVRGRRRALFRCDVYAHGSGTSPGQGVRRGIALNDLSVFFPA